EHEGMLESEPYKGLAVRPVTVDEFLNMYEALGIIEAALARLAATKASAGDIRRMDDALQQAERGIPNDVPEHLSGNREFQALLGVAADAPFLTRVLLGIEERSDMYLINSGLTLSEGNMRAAVADRRAILDRVRQGDADGAAEASLMHAARIRERWQQFYPGAA